MPDVQKVNVEFSVRDREAFLVALQTATSYNGGMRDLVVGYRADDQIERREALRAFVDQMELKLRKNESKRNWREKPIEALVALMLLEVREFEVSLEHFTVEEARLETPDIGNFAMMVFDRLGMLDQNKSLKAQK